jgi:tripartite-type tricarboxylate transporter receptor subunit TctC
MKLPHRRQFLHAAAGAAALPVVSRFAWAQAYPSRPVRFIEGFGAGSAPDIVARLIGQSLSERLGQSFVIENRSGGSGSIATEAVVRASPDGYTLLLITAASAINATMLKLNFNFIRDIAPVASICRVPLVMEVHPSVPTKTVAEFIAYAKANPGKVNMASAGTGSLAPHGRRDVQDDGGPRLVSRALPRSASISRSARRRRANIFRSPSLID